MRRRALLAGAAAGVTAAFAGCTADLFGDRVTRTDTRTYDVGGETPLRVATWNGDVTVEAHGGDAVDVDVEFSAPTEAALDEMDVVGEVRDGEFVVRATTEGNRGNSGVDLTARVPAGVSLAGVETTNGDVRATDVAGGGEFATENGDVTVRDVAEAAVETTNGHVTVRDVESFGGVETTNGDVTVDVPAPLPDDAVIRTENRNVDASLSPELDAAVEATTENGGIELHGLELGDAEVGEERVTGTLGDGARNLAVETTNGDVDLRVLDA